MKNFLFVFMVAVLAGTAKADDFDKELDQKIITSEISALKSELEIIELDLSSLKGRVDDISNELRMTGEQDQIEREIKQMQEQILELQMMQHIKKAK